MGDGARAGGGWQSQGRRDAVEEGGQAEGEGKVEELYRVVRPLSPCFSQRAMCEYLS